MTKISKLSIKFWAKLAGIALALHIVLVIISFAEVAVYSWIIHPGGTESFYRQHAELTGPYVSAIFGFILFFFITRRLLKNRVNPTYPVVLGLPIAYIVLDIVILLFLPVDWSSHLITFVWASGAKFLGSYLAMLRVRSLEQRSKISTK